MTLSVVTVVKNDSAGLEKTIRSIRKAKEVSSITIEYIVIDGQSSDGTLELIKSNQDIIDKFISKPDKGIYDAMNKSIGLVPDGNFIIWINAGDLLIDPSDVFIDLSSMDQAIFASVVYPGGQKIVPEIKTPFNTRNQFPASNFHHQGFLIKKEAFMALGGYSLKAGVMADCLLMSLAIRRLQYIIKDVPVAQFDLTGVSAQNPWKSLRSYVKISRELGFSLWGILFFHNVHFVKQLIKIALPRKLISKIMYLKWKKLHC